MIHQSIFRPIRAYDRVLLYLNFLFLMVVAFVPFPTSLLGETQDPATVHFFLIRGLTITSIFLLSIVISFFSVSAIIWTWFVMMGIDAIVIHRRFH